MTPPAPFILSRSTGKRSRFSSALPSKMSRVMKSASPGWTTAVTVPRSYVNSPASNSLHFEWALPTFSAGCLAGRYCGRSPPFSLKVYCTSTGAREPLKTENS